MKLKLLLYGTVSIIPLYLLVWENHPHGITDPMENPFD